jgi:putative glutathione S-transferase
VANSAPPTTDDGRYERQPFHFTGRITADGRDGWPAEAGRYRIVVSRACPWASRTLVTRRLMGLEDAIGVAVTDPIQDDRSWRFTLDPGDVDPVLGIAFLADAYHKADPTYDGGISVPAIVDVPSGAVVTNDVFQVTLDLATEWGAFAREGAPDLYPEALRGEIDEVNARLYKDLNAAVYEAGFATTQDAYEDAYTRVFACLDWLEERLADQRFVVGDTITEADIRLFTTLIRFDASTTATSSATATRSPRCRRSGPTCGTCSRRRASATPWTSTTSSGTTTRCTPTSIRRRSCLPAPTSPA